MNDVVTAPKGKLINIIFSIITDELNCVEKWCNTEGLTVNPQKITMILFAKKKTLIVKNRRFFNRVLTYSENVKHLVYLLTLR